MGPVRDLEAPRYFAGEVFADAAFDAGALDFLLAGALLFVDAGLVEVGFVFADLGLADAGFVPVASFFGVTFVLEAFLLPVLALTAELLALAAFGLEVEGAFFLGEVLAAETFAFAGVLALTVVVDFAAFEDVEGVSGFLAVLVLFLAAPAPAFSLEALDVFFGTEDLEVTVFFLVLAEVLVVRFSFVLDFGVLFLAVLEAEGVESSSDLTLGANLTLPEGPLGKTKMCLSSPDFKAREIFETTDGVISIP